MPELSRGGGGTYPPACQEGLFKAGLVMHMIFFASGVMKEGEFEDGGKLVTACMSRDFVTGSAPHNDRRPPMSSFLRSAVLLRYAFTTMKVLSSLCFVLSFLAVVSPVVSQA